MDLEIIRENYSKFPDFKLIELIYETKKLRPEVIPFLKEELTNRNLIEELNILEENLSYEAFKASLVENPDLAREYITKRLNDGVSLEVIRLDLKEIGVDVFELLSNQIIVEDKVINRISNLKKDGLSNSEIENVLEKEYNSTTDEKINLLEKTKKRGNFNLILGSVAVFLGILMLFLGLAGGKLNLIAFVPIIIGIERIIKGRNQRK